MCVCVFFVCFFCFFSVVHCRAVKGWIKNVFQMSLVEFYVLVIAVVTSKVLDKNHIKCLSEFVF